MTDKEILDTLKSYYLVEDNWDSYGCPAPSKDLINKSIVFFNQLNIKPQDVDLDAMGGIYFTWNHNIFLTIWDDGRYTFYVKENNTLRFYPVIDLANIKSIEDIIELAPFR